MPSDENSSSSCLPVRVRIRLHALCLWLVLSVPSICVTVVLNFSSIPTQESDDSDVNTNKTQTIEDEEFQFTCYENFTVYHPVFEYAQFWIEGVLLIVVGILGILGNCLTLIVLGKSKKTNFHQLLIVLSVTDTLLIIFFMVMSSCMTVSKSEPQWFLFLFANVLWPMGNISITASVLMVVAVSTERYLAICRPLQYKPGATFYIILVFTTSVSINTGRFLEFRTDTIEVAPEDPSISNETTFQYSYVPTDLMADDRYVMFSRYWTEIVVTGFLPLLALICLNYGIYAKIRKSAKFRRLHDNTVRFRTCASVRLTRTQQQRRSDPTPEDNSAENLNNVNNPNNVNNINNVNNVNNVNNPNNVNNVNNSNTYTMPRKQGVSVTSSTCSNVVVVRQQLQCSTSNQNGKIVVSKRNTSPPFSLNVDSQRTLQFQSVTPHHASYVRNADGALSVRLVVPSAASASIKAQRAAGERSTKLLVGIVVVFLVCHVVRLVIQIDAVVHPSTIGGRHFQYCHSRGMLHSPVAVWILTSFNVFCLVLNSSINFVVYCMVGLSFRTTLLSLFSLTARPRGRASSPERPRLTMTTMNDPELLNRHHNSTCHTRNSEDEQ